MQAFLVIVFVPLICGTAAYLWHLSRNSPQGKTLIILLWLTVLTICAILGGAYIIVMGSASLMMALIIYLIQWIL